VGSLVDSQTYLDFERRRWRLKGTREAPPRLPDRRNATKEVATKEVAAMRQQRTYRGGASTSPRIPPSPVKSCKVTHRNTSRQALPTTHLTRSGSVQGLEELAVEMDRSEAGGSRDHKALAFKRAADEIRKYYQAITSGKQAKVNFHSQTFSTHHVTERGGTLFLEGGGLTPSTEALNTVLLCSFQARGGLNPEPNP